MNLKPWERLLILGFVPILSEEMSTNLKIQLKLYNKNFRIVLEKAIEYQVHPTFAFNILKIGKNSSFYEYNKAFLEQILHGYQILNNAIIQQMKNLITNVQTKVNILCIKGIDPLLNYYQDVSSRSIGDVDLLIHQEEISKFKILMQENGYSQSILNKSTKNLEFINQEQIQQYELGRNELVGFVKLIDMPELIAYKDILPMIEKNSIYPRILVGQNSIKYVMCFDVHHNLVYNKKSSISKIQEIDVKEIWNRSRNFNYDGTTIKGLSVEDMLSFFCARLYYEILILNKKQLRMFNDLISILINELEKIDWNYLENSVIRNTIQPAAFYIFAHIKNLFKIVIPTSFLNNINPENFPESHYYDWGDFLPKLLDRSELIKCKLL